MCVYMRLYKRRAVSRFYRIDGDVARDVGTLGGDPRTCVRARARERLYNIILYNVNIECVREKRRNYTAKAKPSCVLMRVRREDPRSRVPRSASSAFPTTNRRNKKKKKKQQQNKISHDALSSDVPSRANRSREV